MAGWGQLFQIPDLLLLIICKNLFLKRQEFDIWAILIPGESLMSVIDGSEVTDQP